MTKLNLGVGQSTATLNVLTLDHSGWKHIDICAAYNPTECYDISQGIREVDNSVEEIWMGDFFEHLLRLQAIFVAKECYRVLKPGGKVSVCVPDMAAAVKRFFDYDGDDKVAGNLIWGCQDEEGQKNCIADTHKYGYTENSLTTLFKSIGFKDIKRIQLHKIWYELSICAIK
jgi:predicted SAM-dependent methyltransferase